MSGEYRDMNSCGLPNNFIFYKIMYLDRQKLDVSFFSHTYTQTIVYLFCGKNSENFILAEFYVNATLKYIFHN
jgi:hypothetical protein